MTPEVSIVIVCMNNPEILSGCLDSIKRYTVIPTETFVVAYMFSADNLSRLRRDYPWVTIIESNEIRGFAENNNLALKQARGRYCFIVNDDTFFDEPLIDRLVADYSRLPDSAAVVSPKILYPDKRFQYCGRAPFNFWRKILFVFHPYDGKWRSKYVDGTGLFQSFHVMGAAFLIKTSVFREMGFFDEFYFFCPEDLALSEKLNANGFTCHVDADSIIYHIQGRSLSRTSEATTPAMVKGMIIFFSAGSSQGKFFFGAMYFLVYLLRLAVSFLRYCIKKKESDRIIIRVCRNTIQAIFSEKTPKALFETYYNPMK